MASTNPFLTIVSTIQTNNNGSTITTGYIPYVSTAGKQTYTNTLSTLTVSSLNAVSTVISNLNCSLVTTSTITSSTINSIKFSNGYVQSSSGLGFGQSYVNQTPYRSVYPTGGVYTNYSARPMFVSVSVRTATGSTCQITGYVYINGITIYEKQTSTTYNGRGFYVYWNTHFIVPPGATYQVYCYRSYWGGTDVELMKWYELS
jgi:hypothetical protein